MKKEDAELYRHIEKNTQQVMDALDVLAEKIYDKNLSVEVSREFMMFADIQNRARKSLKEAYQENFRPSQVQEVLHKSGLQMGSILDQSTSHVADMIIQENSKSIADICKARKNSENASKQCIELAEELEGFEEKNRERLKKFL